MGARTERKGLLAVESRYSETRLRDERLRKEETLRKSWVSCCSGVVARLRTEEWLLWVRIFFSVNMAVELLFFFFFWSYQLLAIVGVAP